MDDVSRGQRQIDGDAVGLADARREERIPAGRSSPGAIGPVDLPGRASGREERDVDRSEEHQQQVHGGQRTQEHEGGLQGWSGRRHEVFPASWRGKGLFRAPSAASDWLCDQGVNEPPFPRETA